MTTLRLDCNQNRSQTIYVPKANGSRCAVAAVQEWLTLAKIRLLVCELSTGRTNKMAKAGVMLLERQSDSVQQEERALEDAGMADRGNLMASFDGLNLRYGRCTVSIASAGLAGDRRTSSMKHEQRTPAYTTDWNDLAVASARFASFQLAANLAHSSISAMRRSIMSRRQ